MLFCSIMLFYIHKRMSNVWTLMDGSKDVFFTFKLLSPSNKFIKGNLILYIKSMSKNNMEPSDLANQIRSLNFLQSEFIKVELS